MRSSSSSSSSSNKSGGDGKRRTPVSASADLASTFNSARGKTTSVGDCSGCWDNQNLLVHRRIVDVVLVVVIVMSDQSVHQSASVRSGSPGADPAATV